MPNTRTIRLPSLSFEVRAVPLAGSEVSLPSECSSQEVRKPRDRRGGNPAPDGRMGGVIPLRQRMGMEYDFQSEMGTNGPTCSRSSASKRESPQTNQDIEPGKASLTNPDRSDQERPPVDGLTALQRISSTNRWFSLHFHGRVRVSLTVWLFNASNACLLGI